MKNTTGLETRLDKLCTKTFPYQLPKWFSRTIAGWAWLIIPAVVIVQPWTFWGYTDDVRAHTAGPNCLFYAAFAVMALEVALQLMALPGLKEHKESSWRLLYYSVFCNLAYGVMRIFSSEGSIGPLCGIALLSAIFFYLLFQVKPWFKK